MTLRTHIAEGRSLLGDDQCILSELRRVKVTIGVAERVERRPVVDASKEQQANKRWTSAPSQIARAAAGTVVENYAHTWLLKSLAREDVCSRRMRNLRGSLGHLRAFRVGSGDFDDEVSATHARVLDVNCELIARKGRTDG